MNFSEFTGSKGFRIALWTVGALAIAFLIFDAGMIVGARKALFSSRGGEDYYRAFDMHRRGPVGGFFSDELASGNGAAGEILKTSSSTLLIADKDGTEKTVLISPDTVLRKGRETVSAVSLKVDDFVVAIGEPNDNSEITARFIRILPPPPDEQAESTSTEPLE